MLTTIYGKNEEVGQRSSNGACLSYRQGDRAANRIQRREEG